MKCYNSLNEYLKTKYGKKVYKLSISGNMTCPNRDGTIGTGGCIFCSAGGSGEFATDASLPVREQLELAKEKVKTKTKDNAFIAYFQPFSNTYADVGYLRRLFYEAIEPDYIVALSVATRPDCLDDKKIELLAEINKIKSVSIELGLQTIHKSTADYVRRGYELEIYDNAVKKLKSNKIEVITHVIIGLPFETREMILKTVRYAGARTDGIKLQLLHVLKNTDLEKDYIDGKFEVLTLEEYIDLLCECVEALPENVIIHRLTGDGDKKILVAPLWSADKKRVLNEINREFEKRNIKQGRKFQNNT